MNMDDLYIFFPALFFFFISLRCVACLPIYKNPIQSIEMASKQLNKYMNIVYLYV